MTFPERFRRVTVRLGLVVAIVLVAAGCILTSEIDTSAKDLRDDADREAHDRFSENASLVAVFGAEFDAGLVDRIPAGEADALADNVLPVLGDETPGDGKTPAWAFRYEDETEAYTFALAANRSLIDGEISPSSSSAPALGSWEVTAEEAAEIVREHNDTWAKASQAPAVWYLLHRESPSADPAWILSFASPDEGPAAFRVNATTGEYLGATRSGGLGFGDPGRDTSPAPTPFPPREGGMIEGSVDATQPTGEHEFRLEDPGHPELSVRLVLDDPPTSTVNLTLEGPEARTATMQVSPTEPSQPMTLSNPARGTWQATTELEQGAVQDYELVWCATGVEEDSSEQADTACQRVEG